jgi:hypothetical protein
LNPVQIPVYTDFARDVAVTVRNVYAERCPNDERAQLVYNGRIIGQAFAHPCHRAGIYVEVMGREY